MSIGAPGRASAPAVDPAAGDPAVGVPAASVPATGAPAASAPAAGRSGGWARGARLAGPWALAALLLAPLLAAAQPAPRLGLPVRCTPGDDCFVQNYVDRDPGPGWRDFACGHLSYDGHQGTDFRVRSLAEMERGMDVVAAAAGVVKGVRDGEPDVSVRVRGRENLRGRDAGNGVVIDHGGGWETQYSHLKRGSVRVRPGQRVAEGTVLGQIGLSGNTEFPHLDFAVRRDGRPLDPFAPEGGAEQAADAADGNACPDRPLPDSLWAGQAAEKLRYRATGVLIAGFAPEPADRTRAQRGEYEGRLDGHSPSLVFFVEVFGPRRGDREFFELRAPSGRLIIERDRVVEGNQAARFAYLGKRLSGQRWPSGTYTARYRLERDGQVVAAVARRVALR